MAWTAPRTWQVGEVVTAAQLNTHVRDNLMAVVPVGVVLPYASSVLPAGGLYLACDGSEISRATYADLFAVISTAYGIGNGSTTFNVPDLQGRIPVGKGPHADVDTLGENEGLAAASRSPKHHHLWTSGQGESIGGTYGNFPSFDDTPFDRATTATGHAQDTPSYVVLSYIIKAKMS